MKIDFDYTEQIKHFSTQTEHLTPDFDDFFDESFDDDKGEIFNKGLLSGYAGAYSILQHLEHDMAKRTIGGIVAKLSRHILMKGQ